MDEEERPQERRHWARQIVRKQDYLPVDEEGKPVKKTGGGTHSRKPMLGAGADLDFILRALFPRATRKQRRAIARIGGTDLNHRIYIRYTSHYLSVQRHRVDTTIVYLQNGNGHQIGDVKHLTNQAESTVEEG